MAIRLLFYVIIIALLAVAAVWFASGSGDIVAAWRNYEITMSTANFVFATLLAITLLAVVIPMILGLFSAPFRWWRKRQEAKYKKGLQLVTETLAAISTGDAAQAENLMKRSAKLLHQQPIVPLLQAQLAGMKKNESQLQQAFQSMLAFPETKALGSKSLAEFHMRKGNVIPAIPHAEQALNLEPKNSQSLKTTLALYVKSEQYDRAYELITQGKKRKSLTKPEATALQAMLTYLQALQAEKINDDDKARNLLQTAFNLAPERSYIAIKAIDMHNTDQHIKTAITMLKRSWERYFTPDLVPLAQDLLLDKQTKRKLYKKLLNASASSKPYLYNLLAELALSEQDELEAYAWLEKYQQVTHVDLAHISVASELSGIIASLYKKNPKSRWECGECGAVLNDWQAVCNSCNSINSISTATA
jgi:HemY protein